MSDGGDNASHATFEEVVTKTQASNAVIYTVALVDPIDRDANPGLLRRIAQTNGGEAFTPRNADDITEVLQHIAQDIRHNYTIGYVSTNIARNGDLPTDSSDCPVARPSATGRAHTQWLHGRSAKVGEGE